MTTVSSSKECLIWPGHEADIEHYYSPNKELYVYSSPRAGGPYKVHSDAEQSLRSKDLSDQTRAKLTTLLVNARQQGDECPLVKADLVETAKDKQPLSVRERAERLLRYYATQYPAGQQVSVSPLTEQGQEALAWSESTTGDQLKYLAEQLEQKGWLSKKMLQGVPFTVFQVTVSGHDYVQQSDLKETGIKPRGRIGF